MEEKEFLEKLGKKIRQYRKGRGMTQTDLGVAIGYPESSARVNIARMEAGITDVPATRLAGLARAFGVPLTELVPRDPGAVDYQCTLPDGRKVLIECTAEPGPRLTGDEAAMQLAFRALNCHGKAKLIDYARDLAGNPSYGA